MTGKQGNSNDRESGRVQRLTELVGYQGGSVVSRTLLKKDAGTVTLFAFDRGEGLSEHTAPFDALIHVLEGKAQVFIGGEEVILTGGEMVIMPAGKPHSLKAIEDFKMVLIMIRT